VQGFHPKPREKKPVQWIADKGIFDLKTSLYPKDREMSYLHLQDSWDRRLAQFLLRKRRTSQVQT
jgi:hypothetical protein